MQRPTARSCGVQLEKGDAMPVTRLDRLARDALVHEAFLPAPDDWLRAAFGNPPNCVTPLDDDEV